ncbi:MAG TPA: ABC transporter ATP-binding protein [Acidimicrobiales bacterium]|nr:ABC transporter ATP-binding protein [Acidimicrobiales bacterium]
MRKAGDAVGLLRHAGLRLLAPLVALELATAGAPLAIIAVIGVLVGRVAGGGAVAGPLTALTLLLLVQQLVGPFRTAVAYRITRRVDGIVRSRVMELANRSLSTAPLEDPDTLNRLELAGGTIDAFWDASPGGAAVAVVSLSGRYLQVAGAAWLLAQVSVPVAVGLTALVLVAWRRFRRWNRVRLAAVRGNAALGRASRYTSGLANTPPAAKEVRLFGVLGWLEERFRREWDAVSSTRIRPLQWTSKRRATLLLVLTPAVAWAFVVLARAGATPRALAMALQAAIALFSLLFDQRQEDAYQVDFGLEALDVLRQLEADIQAPHAAGAGAGDLPRESIRFEGVRFGYPGSGRDVFTALDLTIAVGSSLAIVGGNGEGKTTLVKLLARMYEPQGGSIRVDGRPLDDLDPESWRRRLAVIFQDFVRYELPAADNVGFGGIELLADERRLGAAAARAGALDVVQRLPAGWRTPLNRQYTGGADLSGGEWQRIALARALFAVEAGAGVLVLDEPTANLDVRAEAALFEDFLDLTRGLTTILISHRFSTVRHADRICVLDGGCVVEDGSHDELLAAGGRYAEMFLLQAARFRG